MCVPPEKLSLGRQRWTAAPLFFFFFAWLRLFPLPCDSSTFTFPVTWATLSDLTSSVAMKSARGVLKRPV